MKKIVLITLLTSLILGLYVMPANAMSEKAEKFLLACRALDAPFPPRNWDRYDLRDASLEVLDAIESGSYDRWPLDFCVKALGAAQFPEDIDRILAYEDDMTYSVLRALKGFPHEKAVNTLIKYLGDEKAPKRESAAVGLAALDFRKLENGADLKNKVLSALKNARQKEKENWLVADYNEAIAKVQSAPVSAKPKR